MFEKQNSQELITFIIQNQGFIGDLACFLTWTKNPENQKIIKKYLKKSQLDNEDLLIFYVRYVEKEQKFQDLLNDTDKFEIIVKHFDRIKEFVDRFVPQNALKKGKTTVKIKIQK